ncbi:hypothetical protein, partial [Streptomyces griseus]
MTLEYTGRTVHVGGTALTCGNGEHGVAQDVDGTTGERGPGRCGHRVSALLERLYEPGEFSGVRTLFRRLLPHQPAH